MNKTTEILKLIANHIEANSYRISTYHIYSYSMLKTKLVIFYYDGIEEMEFKIIQGEITITKEFNAIDGDQYLKTVTYHKECYTMQSLLEALNADTEPEEPLLNPGGGPYNPSDNI